MRMPKMFYDIKPRLSPHMVSAAVRQRRFWDTLESAQHTNLDTAVANIWSDCISAEIREVFKAPVTSSYRAFKQRMEDFSSRNLSLSTSKLGMTRARRFSDLNNLARPWKKS